MGKEYVHIMMWNPKTNKAETRILKSDQSNCKQVRKIDRHYEESVRRTKRVKDNT